MLTFDLLIVKFCVKKESLTWKIQTVLKRRMDLEVSHLLTSKLITKL